MSQTTSPAVSVERFTGGYKSVSDYTDLQDTETNDAENVLYGPNGDIDKRQGSVRLYNTKLFNSTSTATGEPITGHFYFDKLGSTGAYHVVAAGDSIYSYTSATASAIRTGMTDNSNTFFNFIQIKDPNAAADDIILIANGVDPIQMWNGTATCVIWSAVAGAAGGGMETARFILNHKGQVFYANIVDAADADAQVKVNFSGFSVAGVGTPQAVVDSFYVGGSDKNGPILGMKVLNDQIIFYKRNSVFKGTPSTTQGLSELQELQGSIGILAPQSLIDAGNYHIFLSERGVYAFDGVNFVSLSEKVDDELFTHSNLTQLKYAKAVLDKRNDRYILYYAEGASERNNRALAYDMSIKAWQPPVTGRTVSYISTFQDSNEIEQVVYGDYLGYLYQDHVGNNDGLLNGYRGTVSSATISTVTEGSANFSTLGDGLTGLSVKIIAGTGEGQERLIASNTSSTITTVANWGTLPDATSLYSIGGISAYWKSKDYHFGGHDLLKLFREIRLRVKEEGNYSLTMQYIINFHDLAQATKATVSLLENGFIWGLGVWGQVRWGVKQSIRRRILLRNTSTQSLNGTHLALLFSNDRANETFKISGFDIILQLIGRR